MAVSRWKRDRDYFVLYKLAFIAALILCVAIREYTGDYLAVLLVALLALGCVALGVFLKRLRAAAFGRRDGADVVYRNEEGASEQKGGEESEQLLK